MNEPAGTGLEGTQEGTLPTGEVTFLFTDVEDGGAALWPRSGQRRGPDPGTKLWEQQPEAMREALAEHDALLRAAIENQDGLVFKTVGDAFFAIFAHPCDAAQAAIEAQRALQEQLPQVRVRMALHTGVAEVRQGDYFGPALNRVARLLTAGHGGQILLSQMTADLVRPVLPEEVHFRPLGTHRLRDIAATETIFQLLSPDLPSGFPPLNTLDVAFRRGVWRAGAVAAVILAVVGSLVLVAMDQVRRADRNARQEALQRRQGEQLQRRTQARFQPGLLDEPAAPEARGRELALGDIVSDGARANVEPLGRLFNGQDSHRRLPPASQYRPLPPPTAVRRVPIVIPLALAPTR